MSESFPRVRTFRASVEPGVLEDIRTRVRAAWLPDPIAPGWERGTDVAYMRDLQTYWVNCYDWPRAEARLNEHPQFTANVEDVRAFFRQQERGRQTQ